MSDESEKKIKAIKDLIKGAKKPEKTLLEFPYPDHSPDKAWSIPAQGTYPEKPTPSKDPEIQALKERVRGQNRNNPFLSSGNLSNQNERISHLQNMIRKPQKKVMEAGNMLDLKRELSDLRQSARQTAKKLVELQAKIRKFEESQSQMSKEHDMAQQACLSAKKELLAAQSRMQEHQKIMESLSSARLEQQISLEDADSQIETAQKESADFEAELKSLKSDIRKRKNQLKSIPKKMAGTEAEISKNITLISSYEKRILTLDKHAYDAKKRLEQTINQARQTSAEYDRLSQEKSLIEDVYLIFEEYDFSLLKMQKLDSDIMQAKMQVASNERNLRHEQTGLASIEQNIRSEENRLENLLNSQKNMENDLRELEAKFEIFKQLDDAARELANSRQALEKDSQNLDESIRKSASLSAESAKRRDELSRLLSKESELRSKLTDVLNEKKKLEDEISLLSGDEGTPVQKLVIELPNALRQAIKRESDRIQDLQKTIKDIEEARKSSKLERERLEDIRSKNEKQARLCEKQLLYIKKKLESAGYTDAQRASAKSKLDKAHLDIRQNAASVSNLKSSIKSLKSARLRAKRQVNKTLNDIGKKKAELLSLKSQKTKLKERADALRQRKARLWSSGIFIMGLLYPIKEMMEPILNEKTKLLAELDESKRLCEKAEADMQSAESSIENARAEVSEIEQEYVGLQAKTHEAENKNKELRLMIESHQRQLSDTKQEIPLFESRARELEQDISLNRERISRARARRREHQRMLRDAESRMEKENIKAKKIKKEIMECERQSRLADKKRDRVKERLDRQNTRLIRLLDEKNTVQKSLEEFKSQQSILESEIGVIAGIYNE